MMLRRTLLLVSLLLPATARAAFDMAVIDEVMAGFGGDQSVQYVEIRMKAPGQNEVGGSRIGFFKCDGSTFLSSPMDVISSNVPNDGTNVRWIMASSTFAAAAGIQPDFVIDAAMTQPDRYPCGMVCWGKPTTPSNPSQYVDCVAYGGYSGDGSSGHPAPPAFSGTPTALAAGDGTLSLTRICDTGSNAADFALRPPSPTNNAGQVGLGGTITTTFECATTTTVPGGTTTTVPGATTTTTTFPPGSGEPISGTRLVLKTSPRNAAKKVLILLARTAIDLGDPTVSGGALRVFTEGGDAFDATYPLLAGNWKAIRKAGVVKAYKYVNPAGPIRLVLVKQGKLLKAVGRGSGLAVSLATDPNPVQVSFAAAGELYCLRFPGGTFTQGKRYVAGSAAPPASCP